jgi:hypothetical protein
MSKKSLFEMDDADAKIFLSAWHKMNCALDKKERIQINRFRLGLYSLADRIRDMGHSPRVREFSSGDLDEHAEKLMNMVCSIPILEAKD